MTTLKKLAATVVILLIGVSTLSGASNDTRHAVYTTHKVQAGDTFWTVAQRYYDHDSRGLYILDYHDEIKRLNPAITARNCQLQPGDTLTIRYYKD